MDEDFLTILLSHVNQNDIKDDTITVFDSATGEATILEPKSSIKKEIMILKPSYINLLNDFVNGSKSGTVSFNDKASILTMLINESSISINLKIRLRSLQWLHCRELFYNLPFRSVDTLLFDELRNENYLNLREIPSKDDANKLFVNTSNRLKERTKRAFEKDDIFLFSNHEFYINPSYLTQS